MRPASDQRRSRTTRVPGGPAGRRRTPSQQRSRDTVEVLLEGAAQVFDREGAAATTNRIAERAGVSIGTLYQYFPDKTGMLQALAERHVRRGIDRVEALAAELDARRPAWDETARAIAAAAVAEHTDRPRLHELMHRAAPLTPAGSALLADLHTRTIALIAGQLVRCGRGGADPARTAALVVHAADAQLHRVLLRDADPAAELVRTADALTAITGERPG
ncbi:TetR/AcrR family transcriptional regulator [Pseudonocardia humida]|uniref:TetR/AcrR family transcriptional regulator n=1 Tax=Pseudonocardia humida TaxID=2800819 RepID=A0ABT0ZX20_9PSEU|nr:TetR/AcrR family transcriptional regulator [Pseudonocardia humida]MCO1655282.1 TetR/AcrR family transcriptional regulator [Pseudonocardia humida]